MPFIVKLEEISKEKGKQGMVNEERNDNVGQALPDTNEENSSTTRPFDISTEDNSSQFTVHSSPEEDLLDAEIKQDVDELYMPPKQDDFNVEITEELPPEADLTEDDLDALEDFGLVEEFNEEMENDEEEIEEFDEDDYESEEDSSQFAAHGLPEEEASEVEILPVKSSSIPVVPVYSADIEPQTDPMNSIKAMLFHTPNMVKEPLKN